MVSILDYKKFDTSRLEYTEPSKVKGGSYIAGIKYRNDANELQDVVIQSPRLICNTGIVKTDTRSYLELDFDKDHWLFYEFITDIDDHNIVIVEKNSETWFQKKFPLDVVEEYYKSPVKVGRGKNPPKIKVKLPITKGKIDCGIYDSNKNVIHHSDITGNSKMICVLKLIGLRFLKQQVICDWFPLQIRVCDIEAKIPRSYLIDDSLLSDNEEVLEEVSEPEVKSVIEPEQVLKSQEHVEEPLAEVASEPVFENTHEPVAEAEAEVSQEPVVEAEVEAEAEVSKKPVVEAEVEVSQEPVVENNEIVKELETPEVIEKILEPETSNFQEPEEQSSADSFVENLDDNFVNEEDIEKIHEEKLAEFDKNNKIAELNEKINLLEQEIYKRDNLIDKFKSLLN